MEAGTLGDTLNPWVVAMFRTLKTVEPRSASEQAAYAKWLDQRSDREDARADRVHGAEGVIPVPLWIVLFLTAAIIFVFMLFFADSAERAVVQATMIGGVAIVISSTLLLLWFLDNPYHAGVGGLRPVAMERAIRILDQEATEIGVKLTTPCDEQGNATLSGSTVERRLGRSGDELRGDAAGRHRVLQCAVVALVLVGVRLGERRHRAVERVAAAEIRGDRDPVARASVRPRERPAADPPVGLQRRGSIELDLGRALRVPELPDVEVLLLAVDRRDSLPAEHDVGRRLHHPLALDDPLPVLGVLGSCRGTARAPRPAPP